MTKYSEFGKLSVKEIHASVLEKKKSLVLTKMSILSGKEKNVSIANGLRKDIARLKTTLAMRSGE
jgi:ribosomal protein L29